MTKSQLAAENAALRARVCQLEADLARRTRRATPLNERLAARRALVARYFKENPTATSVTDAQLRAFTAR